MFGGGGGHFETVLADILGIVPIFVNGAGGCLKVGIIDDTRLKLS